MAKVKNPKTKSGKPQAKSDDDVPWDDAELDAQQAARSRSQVAKTALKGATSGNGKRKRPEWRRYRATIDGQTFIIGNILRAFVVEKLAAKSRVKKLVAGAAKAAEDSGNEAAAREARRIGRNLFPRNR